MDEVRLRRAFRCHFDCMQGRCCAGLHSGELEELEGALRAGDGVLPDPALPEPAADREAGTEDRGAGGGDPGDPPRSRSVARESDGPDRPQDPGGAGDRGDLGADSAAVCGRDGRDEQPSA